jgi:hypothetical protein
MSGRMLRRDDYIHPIVLRLTVLANYVDNQNQLGFFDTAKQCEHFYRDLLRLVFDWDLKLLNTRETPNYPAIDLADDAARLAVQVTSSSERKKVKETLEKFQAHKLYENYSSLKIVVVTQKGEFKKDFDDPGIVFNKEQDILDVKDILDAVNAFTDIDRLRDIAEFLEKALLNPEVRSRVECSEVETIMSLIYHLSEDDDVVLNEDYGNQDPDPDGKVRRRFKDHATYLTSAFADRAAIYEDKLCQAEEQCGLDAVRARKISLYLRDLSDRVLTECDDDPKEALETLVGIFEEKIAAKCMHYDRGAILYYLLKELIRCNVFPN